MIDHHDFVGHIGDDAEVMVMSSIAMPSCLQVAQQFEDLVPG